MVGGRHTNGGGRDALYQQTRTLIHEFEHQFNAVKCPDLIQLQLGTPEASAEYQARGLSKQCEQYIRAVTERAVVLIQDQA